MNDNRPTLPPNTILVDGFRIERFIGAGGFGITYLGEDLHLGTTVAIKEYYPDEFGDRDATLSVRPKTDRHRQTFEWGRTSFLQEARMLARFRHPSIVRITRVFEANATAYMVMEFEEGRSLENWLKSLERPPTQAELDRIVAPLIDALELMHTDSFLHRDIAPDNIIIRPDGTPVLLDFGAARRAMAEQSRVLTGIIKAGYSPQEQYATDGRLQGPWSDIYALGATLYRAVTGKPPEEATLRAGDDKTPPAAKAAKGEHRQAFLSAIDTCLNVDRKKRPQSVAELRPMLLGIPERAIPTTGKLVVTLPRSLNINLLRKWSAVAGGALLLLGGGFSALDYMQRAVLERERIAAEERQRWAEVERDKAAAADEARAKEQREAEARRKQEAVARHPDLERNRDAEATRREQERKENEKRRQIEDLRIAMQEKALRQREEDLREGVQKPVLRFDDHGDASRAALKDFAGVWAPTPSGCQAWLSGRYTSSDKPTRTALNLIGICEHGFDLLSQPVGCDASNVVRRSDALEFSAACVVKGIDEPTVRMRVGVTGENALSFNSQMQNFSLLGSYQRCGSTYKCISSPIAGEKRAAGR